MEILLCEELLTRALLRRTIKIAKIILPRSRVNDVLAELVGGSSVGHIDANKTPK
jgi:hypothetical protein